MASCWLAEASFRLVVAVALLHAVASPNSMASASGLLELVVSSPQAVLVSQTTCTKFRCELADARADKKKVAADRPLQILAVRYDDRVPSKFNLELAAFDLSGELIGRALLMPNSTTDWQETQLTTSLGFQVAFRFRLVCDKNFYGDRCNNICVADAARHVECSADGEKRCFAGWTGADCSRPICDGDCNGRGECIAPGKCRCDPGASGDKCQTCIPKRGCVHGGCENDVPHTCQCLPGYGGKLCTLDMEYCARNRPCANGGICWNAGASRFRCECPPNWVGTHCEIPIDEVRCRQEPGNRMCLNGGSCLSMNGTIKCHCVNGHHGDFCELGLGLCSPVQCQNGGTCSVKANEARCNCPKCYRGSRCEHFDTDCLVSQLKSLVQKPTAPVKSVAVQVRSQPAAVGPTVGGPKEAQNSAELGFALQFVLVGGLCVVLVCFLLFFCYFFRRFNRIVRESALCTQLAVDATTSATTTTTTAMRVRNVDGKDFGGGSRLHKNNGNQVYKVCVIDADGCAPSSAMRCDPSQATERRWSPSPPPSYYASPPPKYATVTSAASPLTSSTLTSSSAGRYRTLHTREVEPSATNSLLRKPSSSDVDEPPKSPC